MKITAISISLLSFVVTQVQSEFRGFENENRNGTETLIYHCKPNEILDLENYYGDPSGRVLNVTSMEITSCDSVNMPAFTVPSFDINLKKIKIENIRNTTSFQPMLLSPELDSIELRNIGYIPEIRTDNTFHSVTRMNYLAIEKTTIGKLKLMFSKTTIRSVIFRDVCIANLVDLAGLSTEHGGRLEIINCSIVITQTPFHIEEFDHIKIADSTFEFNRTSEMSIDMFRSNEISIAGNHVVLSNNNIINASINVKGNDMIEVTNTCGTRSSMRLDSKNTTSHGNRLASEIIYTQSNSRKGKSENYECPGGDCGCRAHSACRGKHDPFVASSEPNVDANNAAKTVHIDMAHVFSLCLTNLLAYFLVATRM